MNEDLVESIRLGWLVLAEAERPEAAALTTHVLTDTGGVKMLLGLDAGGSPYLLIPVDRPGIEEDVGVVTVRNRRLDTPDGQRIFVAVGCGEPSLRDVFDHFLAAVLRALTVEPGRHPAASAVEVLAEWKALLQTRRPGLGTVQLAALVAELLVLREVLLRDPSRSLSVWRGPLGARHDLRRAEHAIEVKSTTSHTDRHVTVNGVDQLESPGGSLTLAWHRLEAVPDGTLSVFSLADELIEAGVSTVKLFELLDAAGSPPVLREVHEGIRFELRDKRYFAVDEGFPRLVSDSFVDGIPDGVDDITYRVLLPPVQEALDRGPVEKILDRLAGV